MDRIRSFLAIDFKGFFQEDLETILQALEKEFTDVKWTRPHTTHLTLNFFGEIEPKAIEGIIRDVTPVATNHHGFELSLKGIGAFPDFSRPKVLWTGLTGDISCLLKLKKEIDACLEKTGISPEARAFHPHLTLGRMRNLPKRNICLSEPLLSYTSLKKFRVDGLVLFRSDLRKEGPVHTSLHEFEFAPGHPPEK